MSEDASGSGPDGRDEPREPESGRNGSELDGRDVYDDRFADDGRAAAETESDGDSYGPEPNSARIEAGNPTFENAAFVLLGAISMVLVILRLVSLVGG